MRKSGSKSRSSIVSKIRESRSATDKSIMAKLIYLLFILSPIISNGSFMVQPLYYLISQTNLFNVKKQAKYKKWINKLHTPSRSQNTNFMGLISSFTAHSQSFPMKLLSYVRIFLFLILVLDLLGLSPKRTSKPSSRSSKLWNIAYIISEFYFRNILGNDDHEEYGQDALVKDSLASILDGCPSNMQKYESGFSWAYDLFQTFKSSGNYTEGLLQTAYSVIDQKHKEKRRPKSKRNFLKKLNPLSA